MQYLSGLASPVICTGGSRKSDENATKQSNAPPVAGISPSGWEGSNELSRNRSCQSNCITHTSGTQTIVAFDTTPEVCRDLYDVAKFRGQVFLAVAVER